MYHDILVPTDGSEAAAEALDYALDLADTLGSTVHVLHVIPEAERVAVIGGAAVEELEHRESKAEQVVQAAADRATSRDLDVTTAVEAGTPYQEILAHAGETDIDLVVMGTHGRTGVGRFLLGSVTERVTRASDCPVLTIRQGTNEA